MIDRNKIRREIRSIFCWSNDCFKCVLWEYDCSHITSEEAIDIARKNKDVFIKKFHLMNSIMGEKADRSAAFSVVAGVKMK